MDSSLFWNIISGSTSLIALLVMVFLEWTRLKKRWEESASTIKAVFSIAFIFCAIVSFSLFQIGILSNHQAPMLLNDTLGKIGLWTYISLAIMWAINNVRYYFKYIYKDFHYWLSLITFLLTLVLTVYIYYQ